MPIKNKNIINKTHSNMFQTTVYRPLFLKSRHFIVMEIWLKEAFAVERIVSQAKELEKFFPKKK